jgi:hypothetical protein
MNLPQRVPVTYANDTGTIPRTAGEQQKADGK